MSEDTFVTAAEAKISARAAAEEAVATHLASCPLGGRAVDGLARVEKSLDAVSLKVDDIHEKLYVSNGHTSISTRIDRLEGYAKSNRWWIRSIAAILLAAIIAAGWDVIHTSFEIRVHPTAATKP
jgi:hypothetical protein